MQEQNQNAVAFSQQEVNAAAQREEEILKIILSASQDGFSEGAKLESTLMLITPFFYEGRPHECLSKMLNELFDIYKKQTNNNTIQRLGIIIRFILHDVIKASNTRRTMKNIASLEFLKSEGEGLCLYEAVSTAIGEPDAAKLKDKAQPGDGSLLEQTVLMSLLERPILVVNSDGKVSNLDKLETYKDAAPIFIYKEPDRCGYRALMVCEGFSAKQAIDELAELVAYPYGQLDTVIGDWLTKIFIYTLNNPCNIQLNQLLNDAAIINEKLNNPHIRINTGKILKEHRSSYTDVVLYAYVRELFPVQSLEMACHIQLNMRKNPPECTEDNFTSLAQLGYFIGRDLILETVYEPYIPPFFAVNMKLISDSKFTRAQTSKIDALENKVLPEMIMSPEQLAKLNFEPQKTKLFLHNLIAWVIFASDSVAEFIPVIEEYIFELVKKYPGVAQECLSDAVFNAALFSFMGEFNEQQAERFNKFHFLFSERRKKPESLVTTCMRRLFLQGSNEAPVKDLFFAVDRRHPLSPLWTKFISGKQHGVSKKRKRDEGDEELKDEELTKEPKRGKVTEEMDVVEGDVSATRPGLSNG